MASAVNFFQPGTDAAVDANAIARQRQLAELLSQQGRTPPQGQMVSGHFVAPGATSYIAQLASALGGAYAGRKTDEQERSLSQRLRGAREKESNDFLSALSGTPGQPARDIQPLTPNDDEGNAMPVARADAIPGVAADPNKALGIGMRSDNPTLQALAAKLMEQKMQDSAFESFAGGGAAPGAPAAPMGAPGAAAALPGDAPAMPGAPQSGGNKFLGEGFGQVPIGLAKLAFRKDPAELAKMVMDARKPVALREGDFIAPNGAGGVQSLYTQPKLEPGMQPVRAPTGAVTGAEMIPGYDRGVASIAGAKAGATQGAESQNTMVTIDTPQGPRMVTRAQAVQLSGGGAPAAGPAPGMPNPTEAAMGRNAVINDNPSADAAREIAALRNDLNKVPDAGSKKMIQDEIDRLTGQVQKYGGSASAATATQLPGIPLQNAADKVRETKTAEADVARDTARQTDIKTANKFLNIAARVKDVFNDGPTDSTVGSMADSAMAMVGKSTKGAESAQRLKALGGWLVSNVPRMEGPQSNFDVANYQVMAADVANDKLPLARRRAALESIEGMMQEVASGKAMMPPGGAPAAQGRPPAGPAASAGARSIKDFGYSTPDDAIKDAQRALQANPGARAEIMKRLQSMGVQLPPGAQGSW